MRHQTDPYARVRRVQQEAIDALAAEVRVNAGPGCLSGLLCPADAERFDKILLYWVEEVRAAFPAQGRSRYEVGREVRNWFESMVLNKPTAIGGLPSRQFTEEEHARQMSLIEGKLGGAPAPVERSEEEQRRNTEEMVERVQKHAKIMKLWDGLPESVQKEARLLVNADLDPEPQSEAAPTMRTESTEAQEPMGSDADARKAIRGAFVNPILERKNWSTGELSDNAQLDYHAVADYLSGVTQKLRTNTRTKLAGALGVPVEDLPQ